MTQDQVLYCPQSLKFRKHSQKYPNFLPAVSMSCSMPSATVMWILKSLKPDVCHDSTFLQLQQKEYHILARLDHPGIVKVERLEEVEGYGRCIVMEWIDGVTLDQWLAQKHSGLERRQIARRFCW